MRAFVPPEGSGSTMPAKGVPRTGNPGRKRETASAGFADALLSLVPMGKGSGSGTRNAAVVRGDLPAGETAGEGNPSEGADRKGVPAFEKTGDRLRPDPLGAGSCGVGSPCGRRRGCNRFRKRPGSFLQGNSLDTVPPRPSARLPERSHPSPKDLPARGTVPPPLSPGSDRPAVEVRTEPPGRKKPPLETPGRTSRRRACSPVPHHRRRDERRSCKATVPNGPRRERLPENRPGKTGTGREEPTERGRDRPMPVRSPWQLLAGKGSPDRPPYPPAGRWIFVPTPRNASTPCLRDRKNRRWTGRSPACWRPPPGVEPGTQNAGAPSTPDARGAPSRIAPPRAALRAGGDEDDAVGRTEPTTWRSG